METPQGDMIPDSGVLVHYALESSPATGIQLIPGNPLEAAKMRLKTESFNKLLPNMFGVILSRG